MYCAPRFLPGHFFLNAGVFLSGIFLARLKEQLSLYVFCRPCLTLVVIEQACHSLHRRRRDMQTRSFIGMDVHKATISISIAED